MRQQYVYSHVQVHLKARMSHIEIDLFTYMYVCHQTSEDFYWPIEAESHNDANKTTSNPIIYNM